MSLDSLIRRISGRSRKAVGKPEPMLNEDTDPIQNDDVGSYLKKHDTPLNAARHMHATTKLAIIVLGISLTLNVLLGILALQMFPLYRVVPMFVTFSDKADQIVTIDPPRSNLTSLEVLTEAQLREYIIMRHTISNDPQETINRWSGKVRLMSTTEVYNLFLQETKPIYDQMTQRKFTRSVVIRNITKPSPGFWRVEIEAIDKRLGSGLNDSGETRRSFLIETRTVNRQAAISYQDRFLNPLGFTVVNYSIASK